MMPMSFDLSSIISNWYLAEVPSCFIPTQSTRRQHELRKWLDDSISQGYFWDEIDVTGTVGYVWFESHEDLVFYQLAWGDGVVRES